MDRKSGEEDRFLPVELLGTVALLAPAPVYLDVVHLPGCERLGVLFVVTVAPVARPGVHSRRALAFIVAGGLADRGI